MAIKYLVVGMFVMCSLSFEAHTRAFTIIFDKKPLFREKRNQQYVGIDIDVIKNVMQRLDVSYELQMLTASSRLLDMAKRGRADMVLSLSFNEARAKYLIYPKASYLTQRWHFFIRKKDRDKIQYRTFDDLKGLIVGATKGYSYSADFWQAGLELQLNTDNSVHMRMLLAGRIDAVPLGSINTLATARKQGYFEDIYQLKKPISNKIYFNVLTKHSSHPAKETVARRYDEIIQILKSEGVISQAYLKYLGYIPQ